MILTAAALRLAAIEALCPSGPDAAYPTMAGRFVFDSRAATTADMDAEEIATRGYLPILAVYSRSAEMVERGSAGAVDDNDCVAILEIVAEMAVIATEEGQPIADALEVGASSANDAQAALTLDALLGQVRHVLEFSIAGGPFRKLRQHCRKIEIERHAVPEFGLRWHRAFLRAWFQIPDDDFPDDGGLPPHVAAFAAALPDGSYAKSQITALAAQFAAQNRAALTEIGITTTGELPSSGELTFEEDD